MPSSIVRTYRSAFPGGLYPPPLIPVGLRRTPPESGEFGGTQIRRETVLSKYFSHAFQHQITPEYQQNITVLPPDSHRNLMKTSVQHGTPTGLRRTLVSSVGLRLAVVMPRSG